VTRQHGPFRLVVTLAMLAGACVPATAQDGPALFAALRQTISGVVERSERSIVAIARIPLTPEPLERQRARNPFGLPHNFETNDPLAPGFIPKEFGTGIILAKPDDPERGYVLTNYHVVRGGQPFVNDGRVRATARLAVRLSRGQAVWATIYAGDPRSDLAILTFDLADLGLKDGDLPTIPLPEAPVIRKGDLVIALGNPYAIARDGSPSVSLGLISNISRFPFLETDREKETIHHLGTLLHVDTRLGPGTSGGALLNSEGELVGITTSLAALEGYETSVGYAIPIDETTSRIIRDLLQGLEIEYGFLGVMPGSSQFMQHRFGSVERRSVGVDIARVVADSPAHRAGLRPGDVILSVNRVAIFERDDLLREAGLLSPGDTARLRIQRSTQERYIDVRMAKFPLPQTAEMITSTDRYPAWRGLKVDWPTARERFFDSEQAYPASVVVLGVEQGTPAEAAGLREGDMIEAVNDRHVETPQQFAEVVQNQRGDVRLNLTGNRQLTVRP